MIWACGSSASLFEELMELEELDDELLEELLELDELLGRLGVVEEDGASPPPPPPPLHPVRSTAESTTPAVRMRRA